MYQFLIIDDYGFICKLARHMYGLVFARALYNIKMSIGIHQGPSELSCLASFNIYLENGPPVPLLNGSGLYITDIDHQDIFNIIIFMKRCEIPKAHKLQAFQVGLYD
ncbi:hypothetical protein LOD99_7835 [Oopsacas minuta]|uniref:Uncharacterized protein n=1 Tax=Oopsacas minuta TaxID=111878 RepID=A0AAV7JQN6_9METZ|nr:hypothetical protein LOD99_7835 [Oopsacas minuta]